MTGENYFTLVPKGKVKSGHKPTERWLTERERDEEWLLYFSNYEQPFPMCYFVQVIKNINQRKE